MFDRRLFLGGGILSFLSPFLQKEDKPEKVFVSCHGSIFVARTWESFLRLLNERSSYVYSGEVTLEPNWGGWDGKLMPPKFRFQDITEADQARGFYVIGEHLDGIGGTYMKCRVVEIDAGRFV